MPENVELIDEFNTRKEIEEGFSPSTIKEYSYDLKMFFDFLDDKNATEITTSEIRSFLFLLSKEKNYSKKALARKISALRTFFNFLLDEGYREDNPMIKIKMPKPDRPLPILPTEEEVEELVKAIKEGDSKYKTRDLAIVSTFIFTGIRVGGLYNLNMRDIDFENKSLRVKEKGGKTRIVYITDVGLKAIEDYLEERPEIEGEKALFISRQGNRLSKRQIQHIVTKYKEKAGINPKISAHKLRHFFGTMALAQNMDIRLIQKQLGHAQLSTTQIYTHVVDEVLSREYDKAFKKLGFGIGKKKK